MTLDKDAVKHPERSSLGLCVDRGALHVMVCDAVSDTLVIYSKLVLDLSLGSTAKALEEVVYNNPVLLSDFKKVSVSLRSSRFSLLPDEMFESGPEFAEAVAEASFIDDDAEQLCPLEVAVKGSGCTLMVKEERDLVDFIRRTFNNPDIVHPLSVLAGDFIKSSSSLGAVGRMFVHLYDRSLDIVIFGDNGPALLNSFSFSDPMDAVYYIMASRSVLGLEQTEGELYLSGDADVREAITPVLREYLGYVMPLVVPAPIIKAGPDIQDAPFDLKLMMLCE